MVNIRGEFGAHTLIWASRNLLAKERPDEECVDASKICLDFEVDFVKFIKGEHFYLQQFASQKKSNFRLLKNI